MKDSYTPPKEDTPLLPGSGRSTSPRTSPRPAPLPSLVSFKNVLFRGSSPSEQMSEADAAFYRRDTLDSSTATTEVDIESQEAPCQKRDASPRRQEGFTINARVISDATIGLSDGLTVPFALTAGLSALGDTRVVIFGGLAELIAGAISMGLGGYLGAKSEIASYNETRNRTVKRIQTDRRAVLDDIKDVFEPYDLPAPTLDDLALHLSSSPKLADFLLQFAHCTEEPAASRALTSAVTIALGYFVGGLVPLIPYFCVADIMTALYVSVAVMAFALFTFGYAKTCAVIGWREARCVKQGVIGGVEMVVVGGAAAGAAMGLVVLFNHFADS